MVQGLPGLGSHLTPAKRVGFTHGPHVGDTLAPGLVGGLSTEAPSAHPVGARRVLAPGAAMRPFLWGAGGQMAPPHTAPNFPTSRGRNDLSWLGCQLRSETRVVTS